MLPLFQLFCAQDVFYRSNIFSSCWIVKDCCEMIEHFVGIQNSVYFCSFRRYGLLFFFSFYAIVWTNGVCGKSVHDLKISVWPFLYSRYYGIITNRHYKEIFLLIKSSSYFLHSYTYSLQPPLHHTRLLKAQKNCNSCYSCWLACSQSYFQRFFFTKLLLKTR